MSTLTTLVISILFILHAIQNFVLYSQGGTGEGAGVELTFLLIGGVFSLISAVSIFINNKWARIFVLARSLAGIFGVSGLISLFSIIDLLGPCQSFVEQCGFDKRNILIGLWPVFVFMIIAWLIARNISKYKIGNSILLRWVFISLMLLGLLVVGYGVYLYISFVVIK